MNNKMICHRRGATHPSNVAVFDCPACGTEICDLCKNAHRCDENEAALAGEVRR